MALTPSWPGPTGLATTTDGRKALAGLIVKNSGGVPRAGVFPRHANALVTARADMNLDLGIFEGAAVQFGGPILLTNDAVAQLPSPLVSPGAGITNYYIIYAKQNESAAPGTDANTNRVFGAGLSTTSFAAARALLPAGALELGTVQMPTGKTATNQGDVVITATHSFTTTAGGLLLVRTETERAALESSFVGVDMFVLETGNRFDYGQFGTAALTNLAGWSAPSVMLLTKANGRATLLFNATRTAALAAGGVIIEIPAGFRRAANFWGFAWGLAGAPVAVQVSYDQNTNQIKTNQPLSVGHSIALTLDWLVTR